MQDAFWRETFVIFTEPLKGFYRDPISAGAQILSRYLEAPRSVTRELTSDPEYANPDDSSDTWTGRGRKPNWLVARVKKGAKLSEFEI